MLWSSPRTTRVHRQRDKPSSNMKYYVKLASLSAKCRPHPRQCSKGRLGGCETPAWISRPATHHGKSNSASAGKQSLAPGDSGRQFTNRKWSLDERCCLLLERLELPQCQSGWGVLIIAEPGEHETCKTICFKCNKKRDAIILLWSLVQGHQ